MVRAARKCRRDPTPVSVPICTDHAVFHHKFAVTPLIVSGADPRQTGVHHDIYGGERTARFINRAREQRQWLSRELSSLDSSENYESNQRAIRGAIGELDKVILESDSDAGA